MLSFNEYRILVEQAPIVIWRANKATHCDYFNERWLAFTGRSMEQEVGNGWAEGVHKDDFEFCLKTYLGAFSKRESFYMRYRLKRYDGEFRWLSDSGTPFVDENGTFAGYIGSCVDINDQVLADEYIKRIKDRELEQLRGLLPICSYCKKIRDEKGDWHNLESYIYKHSKTEFTHGVCPTCKEHAIAEINKKLT
jgi:PAS domain S-box-containing protein